MNELRITHRVPYNRGRCGRPPGTSTNRGFAFAATYTLYSRHRGLTGSSRRRLFLGTSLDAPWATRNYWHTASRTGTGCPSHRKYSALSQILDRLLSRISKGLLRLLESISQNWWIHQICMWDLVEEFKSLRFIIDWFILYCYWQHILEHLRMTNGDVICGTSRLIIADYIMVP